MGGRRGLAPRRPGGGGGAACQGTLSLSEWEKAGRGSALEPPTPSGCPAWFAHYGGNRQPEGQVCAPLWGGRGSLLSRDPALCRGHCPHLPVSSPSCPEPRPRAKAGCPSTGPGLPRFSVSDPQTGPQERPALKTGTGGDRGILSRGRPSPRNRQASGKATPMQDPLKTLGGLTNYTAMSLPQGARPQT